MSLKLIRRNKIYGGKVFNTIVDEIEYPSGRTSVREVAEHPGGAVVVACFPDNQIILVNQFRYPLQQTIWELPAGKLEPGEEPLHCAQRELTEETGYVASSWQKLGAIHTTPGFCTEQLHLYLASGLTQHPAGRQLEEGELEMSISLHSISQCIDMIENGEITDAKTICGVYLAERMLYSHPRSTPHH